jgi:hypothetical protein
MAKKQKKTSASASRKRRTSEHITEDLSLHHITGLILRAKFAIDRVVQDYGIDLWMQTFDEKGEVEQEAILMQLKAAEDLSRYAMKATPCFSYPLEIKDIRLWKSHLLPFYLILYDAKLREAYWLHTDEITLEEGQLQGDQLRVPFENILGVRTLLAMRQRKNTLWQRYKEKMEESR